MKVTISFILNIIIFELLAKKFLESYLGMCHISYYPSIKYEDFVFSNILTGPKQNTFMYYYLWITTSFFTVNAIWLTYKKKAMNDNILFWLTVIPNSVLLFGTKFLSKSLLDPGVIIKVQVLIQLFIPNYIIFTNLQSFNKISTRIKLIVFIVTALVSIMSYYIVPKDYFTMYFNYGLFLSINLIFLFFINTLKEPKSIIEV